MVIDVILKILKNKQKSWRLRDRKFQATTRAGTAGTPCHALTFAYDRKVGWEILLLPPRACTDIMTGTNHLLGRAHGGKYSLELKPLHKVLIWDD